MDLAAYIRMSTDKQEDSPETQLKIIQEYASQTGHKIVQVYQDMARSGGSMENRAALRELIRDAESKVFSGVIIYKLDRAFRNLGEQIVTLKKLKQLGIRLLAAADPIAEGGAAGDLIVNILGAVNQFERELTGERIYHHNRELAKKGKWTGGSRPPLGYNYDKKTKTISVVPEEAEVIRQIFETFKRTQGTSTAAWTLNSLGYKTRDGLSWSPQLVHNVLTNPFYTGKVRYGYRKAIITETGKKWCKPGNNYEIFPGEHEALVSEEDFEFIQDIFRRKDTFKKQSSRVYVFTGIFKCSMCGGPVTGIWHSHINKKGYRCLHHTTRKDSCKGFNKLEHIIEKAIYKQLIQNIEFIENHKLIPVGTPSDNSAVTEKQIRRLEQKLLRQQDMYEEGILDKESFYQKRKAALDEIELLKKNSVKANKQEVEGVLNTLKAFQEIWPSRWDAPLDYRAIIHHLIKEMYSDGKMLDVIFYPFPFTGWKNRVTVEL